MTWTIPNCLTIFRVLLVPFFLIFILQEGFSAKLVSLAIFLLAAFTDFLDGQIARRFDLKSEFGKFADPLADKILVAAALIAFIRIPALMIPFWIVVLILGREFIITGLRIAALSQETSISTSYLGKAKTTAQMITIIATLILLVIGPNMGVPTTPTPPQIAWERLTGSPFWGNIIAYTPIALMGITATLTLLSGARYLIRNKQIFTPTGKSDN